MLPGPGISSIELGTTRTRCRSGLLEGHTERATALTEPDEPGRHVPDVRDPDPGRAAFVTGWRTTKTTISFYKIDNFIFYN